MKNAFYFTSKALFVLKIFKVLPWLFGHITKQLDLKDKFNLKFYDRKPKMSQPGQDTIVIHILPNILRSKGNQTMKFGQLIKYTITNTFLKKSYPKCGGETSPRPFYGRLKLNISLDQQLKF